MAKIPSRERKTSGELREASAASKRAWRASLPDAARKAERERDAARKARRREAMGVEARKEAKERDRLRKARKRAAERREEAARKVARRGEEAAGGGWGAEEKSNGIEKGMRRTDILNLLNPR